MSEVAEKTVTREEVLAKDEDNFYADVLKHEAHHNHEIVQVGEVWRWKRNESVDSLVGKCGLNELVQLLNHLGYDKNTELYRHMYRCMGYSLSGYWEIFYWEANNEKADEYPTQTPPKSPGLLEMLDDVMNLGMTLRQHQLQGSVGQSGKEALQEYVDNKYLQRKS